MHVSKTLRISGIQCRLSVNELSGIGSPRLKVAYSFFLCQLHLIENQIGKKQFRGREGEKGRYHFKSGEYVFRRGDQMLVLVNSNPMGFVLSC